VVRGLGSRIGGLINFVLVSGVVGILILGAPTRGGSSCLDRGGTPTGTEIFRGVTYGCERLEPSAEGNGFLHWARVDLTAPGIELYVTPMDPTAVSQGWQYRLRWVGNVVDQEHLAVAINGTLFWSNSRWRPWLRGDVANSFEPLVANHVVSHMWDNAYLLWFDDQLTPHLRPSKPLTVADFATAKWGIGGQSVWLRDGKVPDIDNADQADWPGSFHRPNSQTAVAIDQQRKLLFLATGGNISPHLMFQKLADLGAKDGMLLDGGGSSSMAIGKNASGVSPGTVYGSWYPVATQFGVRARRLGPEGP
jgi:Phosphodiester glycosidase